MLSAAGAAAPHLELAVILWSVLFTALRTFTNAQSFVKPIVSGPKAAECEEDVAQRVVRRFFQLNPNLRPAGPNPVKFSYESRDNQLVIIAFIENLPVTAAFGTSTLRMDRSGNPNARTTVYFPTLLNTDGFHGNKNPHYSALFTRAMRFLYKSTEGILRLIEPGTTGHAKEREDVQKRLAEYRPLTGGT